jgi:hypothetical protein
MRGVLADLAAATRADLLLLGPAGSPLAEVAATVERLAARLDDFYVHVDPDKLRAALTAYEQHLDGRADQGGPADPDAASAVAA